MKLEKVSQRRYLFSIQPRRKEAAGKAMKGMLATAWGNRFRQL